tara:strand:- start:2426 stop:2740 length:315 start_codon:yes stop_codon:yes gene_type:complete
MYRSDQIIQLFLFKDIPLEISKLILKKEREIIFKESLYDWTHLSISVKKYKFKRFFYEDNHLLFIDEIKDINGCFFNLIKYKQLIRDIIYKNNLWANNLYQLRY